MVAAAPIAIGLLTVSDRASRGEYEDLGGPAMRSWLEQTLSNPAVSYHSLLVSDDLPAITQGLETLAGDHGCCLILTTGGTGPAPRDVTPEATAAFCERILDGFGEEMRRASLKLVPTAILSRQMAGTRGSTLVINLPGKPSAIADCLQAVFAAVPYCIDLIGGPRLETDPARIASFRPKEKRATLE
jgi:molybdopterin adenylyltransferase